MFAAVLTTALLLLTVVALTSLVREVQSDGYGHRPTPESLHGWGATGMPSAPYRSHAVR